jgi:CheY-like chemotaxis protein
MTTRLQRIFPRASRDASAHAVRILLVDDNDELRRVMRIRLALEGYDVVEAADGFEAIRLFEREPTDVVVTDIYMPVEDGIELIGELRRYIPRVPIVAMSGGGSREDGTALEVATAFGADEVLEKPFRADALIAAIRRVLEAGEGERT